VSGCQNRVAPNAAAPNPAGGNIRREFPEEWFSKTNRNVEAQMEGKPMPPLEVSGWMNGVVSADDMKGKVVVIDFYATWCAPCMGTIPHTNALMAKYPKFAATLLKSSVSTTLS
jgi:thiol-disulfide isomerase/thioredoxin